MMERSVFSGRACFLESLKQTNSITKAEYLVVDSWFKVMTKNLAEKLKPDLICECTTMGEAQTSEQCYFCSGGRVQGFGKVQ